MEASMTTDELERRLHEFSAAAKKTGIPHIEGIALSLLAIVFMEADGDDKFDAMADILSFATAKAQHFVQGRPEPS